MRRRPTWPIRAAGLILGVGALPGLWLGAREILEALRHPPPGGLIGLGLVLGFWLLFGSLFVLCVAVLLTGLALDVRALRNASGPSTPTASR
ncbi:MAG TPA: hypothetical protein VKW76_09215 [Candidatus Binatia bacterium]|nr:hypothetical protein [Candidatus Binatia bacterium]